MYSVRCIQFKRISSGKCILYAAVYSLKGYLAENGKLKTLKILVLNSDKREKVGNTWTSSNLQSFKSSQIDKIKI